MKLIIAQIITVIYFVKQCNSFDMHHHYGLDHQEQKKPIIPILKFISEQSNEGWKYSYESGNGIHAEETGFIKNQGDEKHESLVQQGSITYHDEHGHPITLTYIADENGFRPQGEHLPTPPPIPEDIKKSLETHDEGQVQVTEEQQDTEEKEGYGQAQSYAESQLSGSVQPYYGREQGQARQKYAYRPRHPYVLKYQ